MKFEKAQKSYNQNTSKKSFNKSKEFFYSRLFNWDIYNKVSICIMKIDMKGHFKYLNELINDGKNIMPWSIKITYINNFWTIHVGCNKSIDQFDINLIDTLKRLEENGIEIFNSHNLCIISKIEDKFNTEEIVNLLLSIIENSKLEIIENEEINIKYTVKPKTHLFIIPDNYLYNKEFDEETYKKFLNILSKLEKASMTRKDVKTFHRVGFNLIRNKFINRDEREILNSLLKEYIKESERIKIAIKYLLTRNENEIRDS